MANAYATIANGGQRADVHVIDKVVDQRRRDPWSYKQATKDAISEDIAADISYALQQVVQHGTGTAALALGRPAAGKTGTATNSKDQVSSAWFVGYTPQLSTAVMYVRGDGNEQLDGWLPSYFGADYPAETWTAVMKRDMEGLAVEDFPPPANVDGDAPETGPRAVHAAADARPRRRSRRKTPSPDARARRRATRRRRRRRHRARPTPTPPSPSDPCGVLGCPSRLAVRARRRARRRQPAVPAPGTSPSKLTETMASTEPRWYSGR